jgi:hypothetical protein
MHLCDLIVPRGGGVGAVVLRAVASLSMCSPSLLAAQSSSDRAKATVADPLATTTLVLPGVAASLVSNNKTVTGSFGSTLGMTPAGQLNVFLRASGPLDDGGSEAAAILGDLNGLRNVTRLAAGLTAVRWNWSQDPAGQRTVCLTAFRDAEARPQFVKDALKGVPQGKEDSVVNKLADTKCVRHRLPEAYRAKFDRFVDYGHIWLAGASVEYGRADYRYADTLALAYRRRTENPWAANIGAGVYLPMARSLVVTTLRYERAFETGAPRDYCIPVGSTTALQCRSVPLGPPEPQTAFLWQVEGRRFVNTHMGLDLRATYDLTGRRGLGIELPLLVRQSSDNGFNGAFTIGWRTRSSSPDVNDRFYVAFTVGATYGVGVGL